MQKPWQQPTFIKSSFKTADLPFESQYEIAFIGRSNAGKSSVLNRILGKKLARTSQTPGRTQALNVFRLDDIRYFIDLPGYGFAKCPAKVRQQMGEIIAEYLSARQVLRGVCLIMDIRHPLQPNDIDWLDNFSQYDWPIHIILNKADKLKRGAQMQALQKIHSSPWLQDSHNTAQCFSATNGQGLEDCIKLLTNWLHIGQK